MNNQKHWKKNGEGNYVFVIQDEIIGEMSIQMNVFERKAVLEVEGKKYMLHHTGFWKNNIEIEDSEGEVVLKTYTEKWYVNTSIVEFQGKKLQFNIRNNPLAEYAILENDNEILAYGIEVNEGVVSAKIQTAITNKSYLLDFLLWYLFVPIAQENMGDTFVFMRLLTA